MLESIVAACVGLSVHARGDGLTIGQVRRMAAWSHLSATDSRKVAIIENADRMQEGGAQRPAEAARGASRRGHPRSSHHPTGRHHPYHPFADAPLRIRRALFRGRERGHDEDFPGGSAGRREPPRVLPGMEGDQPRQACGPVPPVHGAGARPGRRWGGGHGGAFGAVPRPPRLEGTEPERGRGLFPGRVDLQVLRSAAAGRRGGRHAGRVGGGGAGGIHAPGRLQHQPPDGGRSPLLPHA